MNKKILKTYLIFIVSLFLTFLMFTGMAISAAAADSSLPPPDKIHYEPLRFELPQTQRVVLKNGIVLHILENHELPLVNINALIKTGTMYDPAGKEGTAELTAYVMRTGGTSKLNSTEVDSQFDIIAASASIAMYMESARISFSVLNSHLNRGLDLLSQIMINPIFEQGKFELARQLKNEEIRRIKDDPQKLALQEFSRLIYQNDPRGRFPSYKSLKNIKRDDLVEFHHRFFLPNNIIFAVSGDITKEQAIILFNRYFGNWPNGNIPADIPVPSPKSKAGIYLIDKEIPQSTIISGEFTIGKNNPDFYAFTVLDFILGSGGFPSRIVSVVRNNEGLAYSAGSFYRAQPGYGVFGSYALTKTSSTMKTLSLLDSILEKIKSNPTTDRELDWAKKSINNGFIFSFATAEQIAWQQINLEYEKLPPDFLISYRDKIEKVGIEDLNNAASKYLDKTKNVVLILGDRKNLDKSPAASGYIPIIPEE
ncbi:MAG: insulinase family protein [Syntrophaceae bacterium]|nr:insulinase family protein [Syntrophaceae bacterium]